MNSKILFFIEPFPIRDSMESFSSIIDNVSSIFKNKNNNLIKIYSNFETLDVLEKKSFIKTSDFLIPDQNEQNFFESLLVDWVSEGLSLWSEFLNGKGEIYEEYLSILNKIYSRFRFKYIFFWGTNPAIKNFCKTQNIKMVAMELGCSRWPYLPALVADPSGVNGNSFLCNLSVKDLPKNNYRDWLTTLTTDNQTLLQESFAYFPSKEIINLQNKKIAFIPLQLSDDANMLRFSPYQSIKEFLEDVLPELLSNGFFCIIKEHPYSSTRPGSLEANKEAKLFALSQSLEDVLWLDSEVKSPPNSFIYSISNLVVTVNSSAGFEALLYKLPLILMGDSVYKLKDLFPNLMDFLSGNFNKELYYQNCDTLLEYFFNHYLVPQQEINNSANFIEFLKKVGDLSLESVTDFDRLTFYYSIENFPT